MKFRKRWLFLSLLFITILTCSIPEIVHVNKEESKSLGSVRNGQLENGWLMPLQGKNFHYFSLISYYLMNSAYVNSHVYRILMDAYKTCEATCPGKEFILMECTRKHGGDMLIHWTHENGLSVDFMVPLIRGQRKFFFPNQVGLFHYLLKFNKKGQFSLALGTKIDFESMARHLIAIDEAAEKQGMRIRKILFHTDLHDELFGTGIGQELAKRNIRFIDHLDPIVNSFHDDHYHIDFEFIK